MLNCQLAETIGRNLWVGPELFHVGAEVRVVLLSTDGVGKVLVGTLLGDFVVNHVPNTAVVNVEHRGLFGVEEPLVASGFAHRVKLGEACLVVVKF